MNIRFHFTTLKRSSLLNLAACVVSVLMLLTFPVRQAHQFAPHFRTPQVRRSVERHTPISQPEAGPVERHAHQAVVPMLFTPADDAGYVAKPFAHFEIPSQVPIARLLSRLKLGSSRSGGQDPLL